MATTQNIPLSLDNLPDHETQRTVSTYFFPLISPYSPKSLEACKREGIEPVYLLYRHHDFFAAPGKPAVIQEQEYEQYEKQRRSMISSWQTHCRSYTTP